MADSTMRSRSELLCSVVTPEEAVLETTALFVALPLYDGEIGIAPRHSPLIGRLGYGELRVVDQNQTKRFYIDGGFVQVVDNRVAILTSRAVSADHLDEDAALERLEAARSRPAQGDEQLDARHRVVAQARAQIRVAQRARLP